ncbi:hypothetical protein CVT26_003893 [Gymnopilus dilepis]|uniref:C2H2-type domain-containing protein n=1 Tax=Gymnopilus dilepis TaxID=231916 RepID=A0A409WPL1_9AGAR|nr:hypothetical protein CVT26_003893 [Gymnopilus dilepis]
MSSPAFFPTDHPALPDPYDELVYPLFAYPDYTEPIWDPKKHVHAHVYQIPRSQNVYAYHDVKLMQQQAGVFTLDEDWQQQQQQPVHFNAQGHLAAYPPASSEPPRIKQEDLSAFSAMPAYSDYQRPPYEPLQHDPNHYAILPQSAPAYYSSFPPQGTPAQPQQQQHHHLGQQQPPQQPHHPQHDARSFPPFTSGGGTVHPAELSPSTDSCSSVSPLSPYPDVSAGVVGAGCDPRFVCQPQQQQQVELKNSLAWRDDRRGSLASIHSEMSVHSVHSHGMVEIEMGMDGMEGLGAVNMAGVVAGGMPMEINEAVGGEEDAAGEEDAEGDEDWEQPQPQVAQQFEMQYEEHQARPVAVEEAQHQQHQQLHSDGEDEVTTESESVEAEGERDMDHDIDAEPEYDSDLNESESESEEDDDDPDDPEFVPRSRRRRAPALRRQSTYPAPSAGSGGGNESSSAPYHTFASYSSMMGSGEGRTLRPRSSSARYTPYPGSYPETSFYADEQDFDNQDAQSSNGSAADGSNGYPDRKRATSTSSVASSSTHLSGSGSGSGSPSSGITTTTTSTARRRLRPSNTLPIPIPVPNLTKKSRGRRVPTMSSLEDLRSAASGAGKKRQTAGKTARMYLCDVEGCGKCFARGEHLKRHVRSIHTYEKPHKCLYPGCGKDFSRHDNLGQHMRVHKDYVQEGVTVAGSTRRSTSTSSRRKAPTQN